MLFDLIEFLDFRWLIAFHLAVVAIVGGPFAYAWLVTRSHSASRKED